MFGPRSWIEDLILAAVRDVASDGVAFVLSSHDPRVMAVADGFVRLDHGRLVTA